MLSNQPPQFHNIKGVLFDIDGTLYHQTPLRLIMAFLLISLNIHRPKELRRKLKAIYHYRKSQEILRKASLNDRNGYSSQLKLTAETTGEPLAYIQEIIEEWFEKKPLPSIYLCRRRDLHKVISLMHRKGLQLGVYSDYPVGKKLDALRISRFISVIVSGSDPEVWGFKPKSNGFAIAATKMGFTPSEILYVGDRPEVDGFGGSEAGMQIAILNGFFTKKGSNRYPSFNSAGDLLKVIEKRDDE